MNRYYLRSLQTETGHQASLAKYERVNSFAKGCGREAFGHSGIDNNNAWPRPDLPAAAFTQIIEIASMHKEQRRIRTFGSRHAGRTRRRLFCSSPSCARET